MATDLTLMPAEPAERNYNEDSINLLRKVLEDSGIWFLQATVCDGSQHSA